MTESIVLAAAGGLCGLLLAWWTVPLLVALAPSNVPRLGEIALDDATRVFTALLSAGVGVACGTIASLASCQSLRSAPDAARSIVPRIGRLRQAIVAATIYQLSHQSRNFLMNTLLIRVGGDAAALAPAIRSIVRSISPEARFNGVAPLQERIDRAFAPRRFILRTIGFFSKVESDVEGCPAPAWRRSASS